LIKNPKSGPGNALYIWPCCGVETDFSTPVLFYENSNLERSKRGCIRADHKFTLIPYCKRDVSDFKDSRYVLGANSILLPKKVVDRFPNIIDDSKNPIGERDIEIFMFDRKALEKK
jgi:hypothetical protein